MLGVSPAPQNTLLSPSTRHIQYPPFFQSLGFVIVDVLFLQYYRPSVFLPRNPRIGAILSCDS
jgi:hypothetical protein